MRRCSYLSASGLGTAALTLLSGCFGEASIPDQEQFAPLSDLATSGVAVARVYAAPIPPIEPIAVHTWFVIKSVDSQSFDRWEVFESAAGTYGHVFKNDRSPTADVGAGGAFVLAELTGSEAEAIAEFIENASPTYPCRDVYILFPGPNSNSYTQWVLDSTSWDVTLPPRAIGKDTRANCP